MLDALACRGPDSAGIAMIGPPPEPGLEDRLVGSNHSGRRPAHSIGSSRSASSSPSPERLSREPPANTLRFAFRPAPGVTPLDLERALGARRGGLEVLSLGQRLDLVKQVGSPAQLEAAYGVSTWRGPLAIGHTRMSTESRIDLSHSQPFWAHGVPDLATVHNGHVTNYHQFRRRYEQKASSSTPTTIRK